MRKALIPALAIGGLVLLFSAACAAKSLDFSEAVTTDTVAVKDNKFEARVIEVAAGTTVSWNWQGKRDHNVAGDGWKSDVQETGAFQHTFEAPGTYDYRCDLHGNMTGRVIVTGVQ